MNTQNEMTFFEHLLELRSRIFKILISLFLFTLVGFYFSDYILHVIIRPLTDLSKEYTNTEVVINDFTMIFLNKLSVSVVFGFVFTLPILLYELFMFVIPAFNKKINILSVLFSIIVSCMFFLGGILFSYFVLSPISINFFHEISNEFSNSNASVVMPQLYSLNSYYSYVIRLSLICGIIFELPVLINILVYIGILNIDRLKKIRRYLYLSFFIIAAILTPPDVVSQFLIAIPLICLYEFSILLAYLFNRSNND